MNTGRRPTFCSVRYLGGRADVLSDRSPTEATAPCLFSRLRYVLLLRAFTTSTHDPCLLQWALCAATVIHSHVADTIYLPVVTPAISHCHLHRALPLFTLVTILVHSSSSAPTLPTHLPYATCPRFGFLSFVAIRCDLHISLLFPLFTRTTRALRVSPCTNVTRTRVCG